MNAVDHVKSALTDAQSALAALIENEATLESIAQAAHAIAAVSYTHLTLPTNSRV